MQSVLPAISANQFATVMSLRPNLISWFLGSGASAASGIPTGYSMITDFKARIFCRENNISRREVDTGDPVWVQRIASFFRTTCILPPEGDPTEYATAFEAVYPHERLRRQYIDDAIAKGTPAFGHRVLGSLMAARKTDCVFTTNFDSLIEEAAQTASALLPAKQQSRPTVAALDSADRAVRSLKESDWPLVAKLHGDYQSEDIKNTNAELAAQDVRMRHVLIEACQRFGMVFVGYSGRDASVMEALTSVLTKTPPFPNGLFWVAQSASKLLPEVTLFLENARSAGVDVSVVECRTFDELAADVIKQVDLPPVLQDHVMAGRSEARLIPVNLPTAEARRFPVLRLSALPVVAVPRTARRIILENATTSPAARTMVKDAKSRAIVAANGRELAAFGNDAEILAALQPLGPKISGTIELDAVNESWVRGLIYDALVEALSRHRPLRARRQRSGHSLVIIGPREGEEPGKVQWRDRALSSLRKAYGTSLTGTVPTLDFPFQEGVFLKLEYVSGQWWCGFEPHTFVDIPRARETAADKSEATVASPLEKPFARRGGDPAGDWRRERWAQRYNGNWARIIDAWALLLTEGADGKVRAFGLDPGSGIDAEFLVSSITAWSRPGNHHGYFERSR
ncbi:MULTISPECIES: SIR2 family protein [unclassified Mesorhizobium]|uniref:SIR2 family NAD-dependent protein deacylase n=1 Tax=unclassified Mesorhizobium TaxID=325217 RepID=UPI0003CEED5D|nr:MULTISPECIES: SIR2 family protein [unclassified Mesorhizobium]ESY51335.1 Sir2-family regulator [Mesorhizobium sp. LNJC374B00]ESY56709.1 Sir2-family regulator [Mesorhizobium sp. LNJC372A00]WJI82005.1 SIR2 family protein [Mesorhizobium sp. C374B]WJI88524.1 SIR2 family protein [Mesorhizobium sp. C372A]